MINPPNYYKLFLTSSESNLPQKSLWSCLLFSASASQRTLFVLMDTALKMFPIKWLPVLWHAIFTQWVFTEQWGETKYKIMSKCFVSRCNILELEDVEKESHFFSFCPMFNVHIITLLVIVKDQFSHLVYLISTVDYKTVNWPLVLSCKSQGKLTG